MIPKGTYYPTRVDANGDLRVLNRSLAHWEWEGAENLIALLRQSFGEALLSVGLRGSVVAGSWMKGVSDVDAYALVRGGDWVRWENASLADMPEVDLGWATWTPDFGERNPRVAAMLATQGRTIWGLATAETLPPPRLRDLVRHRSWVESDVARYCDLNGEAAGPETVRGHGRAMIKTLLRSAFETVMLREGKYATDFYPCVSTFLRHFPVWKEDLYKLVAAYSDPGENMPEIKAIAADLGAFLVATEVLE